MAILLSLETSTGVCSAALHEDGKLLASTELQIPQSTASSLAVMIHDLMKLCNVSSEQLGGVAVAAGPGSYTGLRIGVATAKGICFSMNIPLVSVNTLELMTFQVISSFFSDTSFSFDGDRDSVVLCPMLDARRMEVYCLLADRKLRILEKTSAKVIDEKSFDQQLDRGKILFFGNGSEKCKQVFRNANALFLDSIIPSASKLGELGSRKLEAGEVEELSSFEPFYLKDFVAKKPKVEI
jgi:tRNA threonylcarbamoyladenosine biosynthesis protein TsaB